MDISEVLNYGIAFVALISTSIAWIVKLKWSKEFKESKQAEIEAKIAQMDILREKVNFYESIVSQKLFEYSKQSIYDLEKLLDESEKKYEEINEIITRIRQSEAIFTQKYISDHNVSSIANLNHELRTPMLAIMGFSELLKNENLDIEKRKYYAETINKITHQLISLSNDLMEFFLSYDKLSNQINVKNKQ